MQKKRGLKNIELLGSSSFFNDVGTEIIVPILPFYISALGGGGIALGIVSGFKEGFSSLFKLFGGWFSDIIGKRKIILFFGYFISVIFKFLLGIAGSWQQLVAFVSFERAGKIRDAPRDVIISASDSKKGEGFGIHKAMDTFGAFLGSLIVLFLFWKFNLSFKSIMFIAAGITFFALFPLMFIKEPKTKPIKRSLLEGIKSINSHLKYFIFVAGVFTFANFGLAMFLIARASEITGSILLPIFLYVILNLFFASFAIPFGKLSDKIGRKRVIFLGYLLFFILCFGFIYFDSIWSLFLLFPLYGIVSALIESNQIAFVSDLAGDMKGTAHGFYYLIVGMSAIIAGIVAGFFWDIGYKFMFAYLAVMAFISIVLLNFVKNTKK